jgi:SAM-dependent methyltransferase
MTLSAIARRWARNYLLRTLPKYGYDLVHADKSNNLVLGSMAADDLIMCNFCGTVFRRSGHDHSESLNCPYCDAIARERVAYQCVLEEIRRLTGIMYLFLRQAKELKRFTLLECSPRPNGNRREIYDTTLQRYFASDYDMQSHRTDLKVNLTDDASIRRLGRSFDIIICSHILEHIPDYHGALKNLHHLLTPGGFLVLQVPLLESSYVSVTWDEFHQDNTRVYHRFGFDLLDALDEHFSRVTPVVGLLEFTITSPEIKPGKYDMLKRVRHRVSILGESRLRYNGLGSPDLCDAFVAYK